MAVAISGVHTRCDRCRTILRTSLLQSPVASSAPAIIALNFNRPVSVKNVTVGNASDPSCTSNASLVPPVGPSNRFVFTVDITCPSSSVGPYTVEVIYQPDLCGCRDQTRSFTFTAA